ncbi:MAG: virulence RhuM family protein [Lachnospiraceae bacterium]|jgi:hypothetical protein|nr:virulence RhuM family protein [Lachnospiraceae bacterium]
MGNGYIELYETEDGVTKIDVRLEDDTVWLTQSQMVDLFQSSKSNISEHIKHIFSEGELIQDSVVRDFRTTAKDGKVYNTKYYNLDVIISVGYRVKSITGTKFRQWATKRINEYIRKGFTLDDERLKNGKSRYFKELLQRVRDIRSSERNLYQQVTDIYATSIDYDSKAKVTRDFFATVQNKMHYAAHQHTAAEVIYDRVDNQKPYVGMTNFKGDYVTKDDVKIAKNYLEEKELKVLNLLVSQFLDFAELQALEEIPMTMKDWVVELDNQLLGNHRDILKDKGKISHQQAVEKAEEEFNIYRSRQMKELDSDYDEFLQETKKILNKE